MYRLLLCSNHMQNNAKTNYTTSVGKCLHTLNSHFRRTELQEWTFLEKRNKIKLYIILYNMHT